MGFINLSDKNPFAYLDQPEFQTQYKQGIDKGYDYLIFCEGMHCSSCVHLIEKLTEYCPGVSEARVNFGQSTVAVTLAPEGSLAKVAQAISELGYTPRLIGSADNIQDKYTQENRTFLKRIAVAGFCAGNIMLFTIPIYAGLSGVWEKAFNAVGLLLFLPVLMYSAQPFYHGTLNALKFRTMNVDLPITIAMLSGFSLSTWNFINGKGDIYYDSTASFLFLILSARYLLKRVQQNYLAPARMETYFKDQIYECMNNDTSRLIPWNLIRPDDIIRIRSGQTLPTDCELLGESATVDSSLFNGESVPQVYSQGMQLLGGTKLLSSPVLMQAKVSFEKSKIGQLFQDLDQKSYQKSHFVGLTERLAQHLIIGVFSLAAVFAIGYSFVDLTVALQRALALIVIACPCALAFGSPLTLGLALKKAQKQGILIKSSNVFEKVLEIKNVFFDKTGTLTTGNLSLTQSVPADLSADLKSIILGLESSSQHPIAFAIRQAWADTTPSSRITDLHEIVGYGVKGQIHGDQYKISTANALDEKSQMAIQVQKNGMTVCHIFFEDRLREEAPAVVKRLHAKGIQTFLLSGDTNDRTKEVAQKCFIPNENALGEMSPQEKFEFIKTHDQTCMIGDGANDSLSLKNASVGIAVKGSVDLSLQYADVYFTRGGLNPLLDLFALAERTRKVLTRTLSVSLIYNLLGGAAALLGFIDPMMAAILMPISSALIVLTSLWGMR
ncbi:heavy metal translocating P-type ATPase [Bdellovibrio sp. HCB288]|uniref:heavy metal translocating P-type ATPase n=1 Tax=Bdellovibrio sp. HCB288 TaxID=3394355 RepID=UPI0039B432E7